MLRRLAAELRARERDSADQDVESLRGAEEYGVEFTAN